MIESKLCSDPPTKCHEQKNNKSNYYQFYEFVLKMFYKFINDDSFSILRFFSNNIKHRNLFICKINHKFILMLFGGHSENTDYITVDYYSKYY